MFVVGKDNHVSFRPVKVGIPGEKYFEVLSGLQEGENVVAAATRRSASCTTAPP